MFVVLLFCFLLIFVLQTDFDAINKRQFCIRPSIEAKCVVTVVADHIASALFVIICSFICKLSQAFKLLQWLSLRIFRKTKHHPKPSHHDRHRLRLI